MPISTNINISTMQELQSNANDVLCRLGLDMSTAVNIFLTQLVYRNAIPFDISAPTKKAARLWANLMPYKLSEMVKKIIRDADFEKYVSIASAWEVAIKLGTGKLSIDGGLSEFFSMIDTNGFNTLGVERKYFCQ